SPVNIDLFDINGRKLATIFNGAQSAGAKSVEWNTAKEKFKCGTYILRFTIRQERFAQKIIICN
ncbi:MAG: T9SS type A sorting domain-containing protein, partial [Chitinophagales bacterium]